MTNASPLRRAAKELHDFLHKFVRAPGDDREGITIKAGDIFAEGLTDRLNSLRIELERPDVQPPAGWKLVPVEPTPEMTEAGWKMIEAGNDSPEDLYRFMLAASPAVPGERHVLCDHCSDTHAPSEENPVRRSPSAAAPGAGVEREALVCKALQFVAFCREWTPSRHDCDEAENALTRLLALLSPEKKS